MKKLLLMVSLLLLLPFNANATAKVMEVTSPSGIKAWMVEEHAVPIVSIKLAFRRAGSAYDPAGKAGLAYFVSSMVDEGAGDLRSLDFQKALEDKAIQFSLNVDDDFFFVEITTLSEHLDEALRLLSLAILSPRFDEKNFAIVKNQIDTVIVKKQEDPDFLGDAEWNKLAFGEHAYARPKYGSRETVKSIKREDLRQFVKDRLTRSALVMGVVGDITPATLQEKLDHYLGTLPAGNPDSPEKLPHVSVTKGGEPHILPMNLPQSIAVFGFEGINRKDPDFYPAYLLNYVLGGGVFESRLMQEVREKRGLAYSIFTYLATYQHAAIFKGTVATEREKIHQSLKIIREQMAKMRDKSITQDELDRAKQFLVGSFPLKIDKNGELADFLLSMQIEELGIDFLEKRNQLINQVTLEQVNKVAKRLLNPDHMLVVVVGGE